MIRSAIRAAWFGATLPDQAPAWRSRASEDLRPIATPIAHIAFRPAEPGST
jgi:hypothetical protein